MMMWRQVRRKIAKTKLAECRKMVGTAGFEPATTTPPVWCATRLRYAPKVAKYTGNAGDWESQFAFEKTENCNFKKRLMRYRQQSEIAATSKRNRFSALSDLIGVAGQ